MVSFDDLIPQEPAQRQLSRGEQKKRDADEYMKSLKAGIVGAGNAITFNTIDELAAGLRAAPALVTSDKDFLTEYEKNLPLTRENVKQTEAASPNAYLGGQVAGAIGSGVASVGTKGGAAIANSLRSGNILGANLGLAGRAIKAGTLGAATSGATGFGAGEGIENRLESSRDSAVAGGVIGGVIPVGGAVAGKIIGKPVEKASDYIARKIAASTGEVPKVVASKAMNKIAAQLQGDLKPDEIDKVLNSYASKQGQSLVEAGGSRTAQLAETAAQYPSGRIAATEFFDTATANAPENLKSALAKKVSSAQNYYDTADKIVDEGRAKVAPLYSQAYKANQQVESPVIDRILQTPEGRSALSDAARNMQNEMALLSKPDPELTALAREAGMQATGQGIGRGLKLRTLDYIKRSMDDTIRTARRAGDEGQVRRITQLKNGLLSEMDANDKTGLYAKARAQSGDYLSANDALEQGTRFLKDDSQLIARNYGVMGNTEKKAYKAGAMKAMREQIEARDDGSALASLIGKQGSATSQKLKAILSPKEYDSLLKDADAVDKIYKLRTQVTRGSQTASRTQMIKEFDGEAAQLAQDIASGRGLTATALGSVSRFAKKAVDGLSDKSAKEVAEILYETDPKKKYAIVRELANLTKSKGNAIQATQAAKKLQAFYSLSDGLKSKSQGQLAAPAGMLTGGQSPTRIEVNPNQPNPYSQELPSVDLPQLDFNDLIPVSASQPSNLMGKIKQAESAGNPNAKNPLSSASGLYQFTDSTWRSAVNKWGRKYGITHADKANPQAQEAMAQELTKDNARILQAKGVEPTDGNLYFAHFMGAPAGATAIKMLGTNAIAARSFPSAAKANPTIFFSKNGKPRTIDEVYQIITSKVV